MKEYLISACLNLIGLCAGILFLRIKLGKKEFHRISSTLNVYK